MSVIQFVHTVAYWWTPGLFPMWDQDKWSCCDHSCKSFFVGACLHLFWLKVYEWMAMPYGKCIFSFTSNWQAVFQSRGTSLHSRQWCVRVQLSTRLPALGMETLLNFSRSNMPWYLVVVFTSNTLINNDAEPIFMCLLSICVSSFMKGLIVFAYFYREIHTHICIYTHRDIYKCKDDFKMFPLY